MSSLISSLRGYVRPFSPRPRIHQSIFRRTAPLNLTRSIVSFTFDDFPRSAALNGAPLLEQFGARGTYYAALGLMDTEDERGPLMTRQDLETLISGGHEIGCHTYSHSPARRTPVAVFEAEILRNRRRMEELFPGYALQNFCYPGGELTLRLKRRMHKYATSCRGTYRGINRNTADLNLLLSEYLFGNVPLEYVRNIVDECRTRPGWIIFYGHEVCAHPSRYGCTPEFLENVLKIVSPVFPVMTVAEALRFIKAGPA